MSLEETPPPSREYNAEDDDDSDNELFEEMLKDRGPLVTVAPESVVSKQLEDTLRHLWGAIKLNEKAIKRAKNAKKAQAIAQRKATIQSQMAGLPGGSRPGTPGQPAEIIKSDVEVMSDKWTTAGESPDAKLGVLFEMLVKTMKSLEGMKDDMAHNAAIQAAKDDAQDEVMQMEFDHYDRKFNNVLKYKDLHEAVNQMDAQVKSVEAILNRKVLDNKRQIAEDLDQELDKVLGQVKGIIEATEEQDKLLDDRVQRLVEKTMESPAGGGGSHTHSKETVIIQQQAEKQQQQDHTLINKLKDRVNQMELDHAKNQNLIQRLAAQCEAASDRAKRSEDMAKELETKLLEATTSLNEEFTAQITQQVNNITTTIVESTEKTESLIEEAKKEQAEAVQEQIVAVTKSVSEEIKQVTETVVTESISKVEQKQAEQIKQIEIKQEEQIVKLVEKAEAEEHQEEKQEHDHMVEELEVIKQNLQNVEKEAKAVNGNLAGQITSVTENVRRQSMAQVQLVSKQMNTANVEITNRIDEVSTNAAAAKVGVRELKESVEQLTKLMNASFATAKKEQEDSTAKIAEQAASTKSGLNSAIAELHDQLKVTNTTVTDQAQDFEDSNFALQGAIADLNDDLNKLATKSELWDVIQAKLDHHVKTLGKECTQLEESVSSSKPTVLPMNLQRYLAGNTQRIAKLVATKADFEVIRKIVSHSDPTTVDWDEEVTTYRNSFRNEFLAQVKEEARKKHPITDILIDEARDKFMHKLDLAIKVAISKYARVQIGQTLLGRRQLVPTCMACDRPFNPAGADPEKKQPAGDMRGVSRDPLPQKTEDDSSVASYTSFTDGSRNSNNYNVVPFGVDQRKLDKYVFRAGFKIPKHVSSPLMIGNSNSVGELNYYDDENSVGSIGSSSVTSHGRSRPHTVNYSPTKGRGRQHTPQRNNNDNIFGNSNQDTKLPEVRSPMSRGFLPCKKFMNEVLEFKSAVPFTKYTGGIGHHAQGKQVNAPGIACR
ncbi:hypothetical protein TrST_g11605 [Triparma strigata]|uniref:Uncharacterized protein n=1 Tax=Triparma strigata TaxID=1606541 RepID=A0A9W7DUQ7_9STRA|nr:hypothetical protein TrST_g11605 [Triparma strigata]